MKSKVSILLICSSLLLSGCALFPFINNKTSESDKSHSSSSSSSSQGDKSSSSEDEIFKTIDIYAINDFHGAVEEGQISGYKVAGLGKLMTYLKDKGDKPNTLLLDQGDTWQGSVYSNNNKGQLITDVMNYVQFDSRTVGNHDFDWGLEPLMYNKTLSYEGYSTPVLAGNVYDYDFETKTEGTHQMEEIGVPSVTYTLDNGLKVGILGCIGSQQITSITSSYTTNICFKDHIAFIKDEATKLREDGCDIVIGTIHSGSEDVMNNGLSKYVDIMFCGHTHRTEMKSEGSCQYLQYACNGEAVGHVTMTYDTQNKKVNNINVSSILARDIVKETPTIDEKISSIMVKYAAKCEAEENPNQIIATGVYGEFLASASLPNLMARTMYDRAALEGFDVDFAYVNKARANISSSDWTYADIFRSFPFENEVYIMEVTGKEMMDEVLKYNYIYRSPNFTSNEINLDGKYTIACIDYLNYHTNEARYYDYFPESGGTFIGKLSTNYRIILREWLINNGYNVSNQLRYSDYLSSNWAHDNSVFVAA